MDSAEHLPPIIDALGSAPTLLLGLIFLIAMAAIGAWIYKVHRDSAPTASAESAGLANTGTVGVVHMGPDDHRTASSQTGPSAAGNQTIGSIDQRRGLSVEEHQDLVRFYGHPQELAKQLGMAEAALAPILREMDRPEVSPQEWAEAVAGYVQRVKDLEQQVRTLGGNDPTLKTYEDEAEAHIAAGRLDAAQEVLGRLAAARMERGERQADAASQEFTQAARAFESMAEAAELAFDDATAAAHFANAAQAFRKAGEREAAQKSTHQQAEALCLHGDRKGDNDALRQAIYLLRHLLEEVPRRDAPDAWARLQVSLGNALQTLGSREAGRSAWKMPSPVIARRSRKSFATACPSPGP